MEKDLENRIQNIYIPHLQGKFEEGQVILFTGCGFSRGANNILGQPMPLVEDLKKAYWKISYPGDPYESTSSLQDLFDTAVEHHKNQAKELTIQLLSVNGSTLQDYYALLFSFPWLRAYTLNVDDLADCVYRRFELPRRINSVSATARDHILHIDHSNVGALTMIQLNGMLKDIPDFVTFSTTQYAERIAYRDPWYQQLMADFIGRSIVFVGTTLDEPPLWQHVEIRRQKGGRDTGELRPRSYLVTPSLSRARQDLLAKHNVIWLPFDISTFVQEVLKPIESSIPIGQKILSSQLKRKRHEPGLPLVSELAIDVDSKTEYLLGQEPQWSDIHSGRAVERNCDNTLSNEIQKCLKMTGPKSPIVITGTAGSGKSTALMRTGLKLSASGVRVAWVDRSLDCSARDIVVGLNAELAPQLIAIDDADVYGAHLTQIIRECVLHEKHPLLLVEIRSNKVDKSVNLAQLWECKPIEVSIELLTDEDIDKILEALDRENRLGRLKGLSLDQKRHAFRSKAGRELVVAMYEATTGLDFRTKMVDELYDLEGVSRFIYAIVAVASNYRFDLTRDEVIIAAGDASNTALNEIEMLIRRNMIVHSPNDLNLLRCRHRVIANVLIEALIQHGEMYDVIYGLLIAATTKRYDNGHKADRPNRIIRQFLNHDFVYRTIDMDQGRRLYGNLENNIKR